MAQKSPRIIKKYPNRRLYDTDESRYVTLDDVRDLIVADADVIIRDAKTDEDVTRQVLLQLIVEQEKQGTPILSTRLLVQVIQFYDGAMQNAVTSYLENSMDLFEEQQRAFNARMNELMAQNPWTTFAEFGERYVDMLAVLNRGFLDSMIRQAGHHAVPRPGDADDTSGNPPTTDSADDQP